MLASCQSRYRLLQLALFSLLAAATFWKFHPKNNDVLDILSWPKGSGNKWSVEVAQKPVLGEIEDTGRLYYPPLSTSRRLQIAKYVEPPSTRPRSPMFIGFTNNWPMLYQCVLSYIAAGWPPEDIIVVENTPSMDSNPNRRLSKDNYFYLDHARLRSQGVSILQTPVLLSFSQLQNFYLRTALAQGWKNFFWSHMDVIVLAEEDEVPFRSFYQRALDVVVSVQDRTDWAIKWFSCGVKACDMLVLVNVAAWKKIGAWDPFIPYYSTDCDAMSRMVLNGYPREMAADHKGVGHVFDVGQLLDSPEKWLFPESPDEQPNSERYQRLRAKLEEMQSMKLSDDSHRNDWQESRGTGKSAKDDWGYDQKAFRAGWWSLSDAGRALYQKKWGTDVCHLETVEGLRLETMWKPLYDDLAKEAAQKSSP